MRVQRKQDRNVQTQIELSRRNFVKRLATATLIAACVIAVSGTIGCKSTPKRESKTIDDFLQEEKPSW